MINKILLMALAFAGLQATAQTKITDNKEIKVLVLFNSTNGGTYKLAKAIAQGITQLSGARAVLKQVPDIDKQQNKVQWPEVPFATIADLTAYDGIAFGSPVHFGNMSASMRYFLDQSVDIWLQRKLEGIPATVFMSAGSGAGNEAAIQSFWNTLAIHGMIIVPTGIMGVSALDKTLPQGNTPFGASSLGSDKNTERPSAGELNIAKLQGFALAKAAKGLKLTRNEKSIEVSNTATTDTFFDINKNLIKLGIELPAAPAPVGSYAAYKIAGKFIYINQIALNKGKLDHKGLIGAEVSETEAKAATKQTLLNILAVLKNATGGDLNHVKQAIQLTGFFNTAKGYTNHAVLMNEASDLLGKIMGSAGIHTRATVGASSLPMDSPVEIQAIFELK